MGDGVSSDRPLSDSETFEECFPYYLSIGMTPDQYWKQDCELVKAYRKADDIRRKRVNQEAWLHGAYIYHALCDVAPILHAFAKNGTEALPYLDKPFPLTEKDMRSREDDMMRARASAFAALVEAKNAEVRKRKQKEVECK